MPIALDDDFDDVPALRREIQRLNDKIDRMTDQHCEQIEKYICDRLEMAKWLANVPGASYDKTIKAVSDTLGDTTWQRLPHRM